MKSLSKIVLVAVLTCLLAAPAFGRDETLISGPVDHGGYGGPSIKVTAIKGNTGVLVGGYGGWFINHTLLIGGGGYGLVSEIKAPAQDDEGNNLYYELGYGGFMLEYVNKSHKLCHYTLSTLIGAGGLTYSTRNGITYDKYANDAFFVVEPSFNLELNVASHFRVGFGVSYRYVNGLDIAGITEEDLTGVSANLNFKFGSF